MTDNPPDPQPPPLLLSELAEVYLLLDNISAVDTKSLPDLSSEPLFAEPGKTWLEQLAAIRWPPAPAAPQNEALNAAKLIRAPDALNYEAYPASGASIAFSLMVAGEAPDSGGASWNRVGPWRKEESDPPKAESDPRDRLSVGGRSRVSLAAVAYPLLHLRARRYRFVNVSLSLILIVALVLTCALSWHTATSRALLARVDEPRPPAIGYWFLVQPCVQGSITPQCAPGAALPQLRNEERVALDNLRRWVEVNGICSWLVGGRLENAVVPTGRRSPEHIAANVDWARVLIGALVGTVLPFCYGLLGAAAAVVRSVSARMAANTLLPRNLVLAPVQIEPPRVCRRPLVVSHAAISMMSAAA